jgi:hypothetical protein
LTPAGPPRFNAGGRHCIYARPRNISAIRSAIMMVGTFVFAHGIDGISDASHT